MVDNTRRFSDRVSDYIRYRPSYPKEMIDYLVNELNVGNNSDIADIGSGTGIFTELLLDKVNAVYAVEPNREMRDEAEKRLGGKGGFISVDGSAESTNLAAQSVDYITAAQAFHWFDLYKAKAEFARIIKANGLVILIWNKRQINTPFLEKYENILKQNIPEYSKVNHHRVTDDILNQFLLADYRKNQFGYFQRFDLDGVIGRLGSSSYTPRKNTSEYRILLDKIQKSFEMHSSNGCIDFNYVTEVYSGRVS